MAILSRPCSQRKPAAFTLVELLVVISIVSVLVALLLPSLATARKVAKRALCLSQQRQLTFSEMTYATDYQDWFPINGGSVGGSNALLAFDSNPSIFDWISYAPNAWFSSYFPNGKVRFCPSGDPGLKDNTTIPSAGVIGYDSNNVNALAFSYRFMTGASNPNKWFGGFDFWYYGWDLADMSWVVTPPCIKLSDAGTSPKDQFGIQYPAIPQPSDMACVLDLYNPAHSETDSFQYLYWIGYFALYNGYAPNGLATDNHPGEGGENVTFIDGHGQWRSANVIKHRLGQSSADPLNNPGWEVNW